MPFKLKLKKTRQYNVASKSLFVISVELLDGGVADCTLSVDSTGQECLDNVCQRQAITQPEFFGLRYVNQSQQPRWVQLERPLKRQLEKYASSHQLYLRVMYYVVSGTSLITDEITRYHYFLQLKNDLVEGRMVCDCQQAVVLASYSLQAEYGNHDTERHTVEYLKNLLTFPKQMLDGGQVVHSSTLAETGRLEWLTAAVIQHHMALRNMSQAQAEEAFITACQQLRGYGQEMFAARDRATRDDVTIAVSLTGLRVLTETSEPQLYRWMDITNVINRKSTFSIECQAGAGGRSASFQLGTPEAGKYVWRLCVLQHTFYMRRQGALASQQHPHNDNHRTNFQELGLSESREDLECAGSRAGAGGGDGALSPSHRAHSASCLELRPDAPQPAPRTRALLPQYRPAPDYETAVQHKYQQQRAAANVPSLPTLPGLPAGYGSHPDIPRVHYPDVTRHTVSNEYDYGLKFLPNYPFAVNPNVQTEVNPQMHYINVYKPPPPYPSNGLASNSTPDLAVASQALNYHRGHISSHVSGSSPDLVSTRTAFNRQYLGYLNPATNAVNYGPSIVPTHGTYNNLASVLDPNPRILIDPHHVSDNFRKVCDERGNIMYSMPMHHMPYQRHLVLPQQPIGVPAQLSDTPEPIYENVPLPWQGSVTMRDRAQSLTTTDEIARLNERNSSHPTINQYRHATKPFANAPITTDNSDSHYVNAQVIKGVRESSLPKDLNHSSRGVNVIVNRSIDKPAVEFDNVTLSLDRISLKNEKECDETPYQSLSTHRVPNNTTASLDNVTSIAVADHNSNIDTTAESALSSSIANSTYSTSIEVDSANTTKSSQSKEKKRRRWGMFLGRGTKAEVKSATLGRERAKVAAPQPPNKHRWSTGLPKFQPLPPSITKDTLVRTALLPAHAALNGFSGEHLPYEDNRVRLPPTPDNPHGYINASHITMTVGSTQRFYVVIKVGAGKPQPPKLAGAPGAPSLDPGALAWECAWQVGARLVAHIGPPHAAYLPPLNTTHTYGKFLVTTTQTSPSAWGCSARVRVACSGRARALWHVACHCWPDGEGGEPNTKLVLGFLSELNSLRLSVESEAPSEPGLGGAGAPVVFCCAQGAGRSGVALAADLLMHILDTNQELDIPRTIGLLHQQRAHLVHNLQQYRFLHQLLLHYLHQSRLI